MATIHPLIISCILFILPQLVYGGRYSETGMSDLKVIIPMIIVALIFIILLMILVIFYYKKRREMCPCLLCRECFSNHTKLETIDVMRPVSMVNTMCITEQICSKCEKTPQPKLEKCNSTKGILKIEGKKCKCTINNHCTSILCHANNIMENPSMEFPSSGLVLRQSSMTHEVLLSAATAASECSCACTTQTADTSGDSSHMRNTASCDNTNTTELEANCQNCCNHKYPANTDNSQTHTETIYSYNTTGL